MPPGSAGSRSSLGACERRRNGRQPRARAREFHRYRRHHRGLWRQCREHGFGRRRDRGLADRRPCRERRRERGRRTGKRCLPGRWRNDDAGERRRQSLCLYRPRLEHDRRFHRRHLARQQDRVYRRQRLLIARRDTHAKTARQPLCPGQRRPSALPTAPATATSITRRAARPPASSSSSISPATRP